jgi:hypothetical protein
LKSIFGAVVAVSCLMAGAAQAAGVSPFLGGGFTVGGDEVSTLTYENHDSATLRAGGLLDLRAGLEYRLWDSPFSVQGVVAYHTDISNASNGSAHFSRVPLELLVHWHPTDKWALGGGVRKATSAKYSASGAGKQFGPDLSYTSSVGLVVEAEYFIIPSVGLKARYVNEEYTPTDHSSARKDGSHVGVIAAYYFR